jgi:hypothetical protein
MSIITIELLQKNGDYVHIGTHAGFRNTIGVYYANTCDTVKASNVAFDQQTGIPIVRITAIGSYRQFNEQFFSNKPQKIISEEYFFNEDLRYGYIYSFLCHERIIQNQYEYESLWLTFMYNLKNPPKIENYLNFIDTLTL